MSFLPVDNYTQPFWLSEEDFIATYRSTDALPSETQDVTIIGSGYAGTSTAYYLYKESPELKVTMLEARNICSGATGRNGGHLKPFYFAQHDEILENWGLEVAAANVEFEYRHLAEIKRLVEEEELDCDLMLTRTSDIFYDQTKIDAVKAEVKNFFANPHIPQEIKDVFQVREGKTLKIVSCSDTLNYSVSGPALSLWPWKFITGLLKKLIKKECFNLQANTPLTSFKKLDDGTICVSTPRGDVITKKLVFATNGYTKAILSEFKDVILPFKGTVTHIVPKTEAVPHLNFSSVLYFDKSKADYLINRTDGTIVIGGGNDALLKGKKDLSECVDTVDDSYILSESKDYLQDYANKTFSSWAKLDTENDYYWSGIMGYSNDELPYVGSLSELEYDNCYIVAGFSGHGMPRVLLSGKALAKSMVSGKPLEDIPECFKMSTKRFETPTHKTKQDMLERFEFLNISS